MSLRDAPRIAASPGLWHTGWKRIAVGGAPNSTGRCAMGMRGYFRRVPDEVLARLLASPDQIRDFLDEEAFPDLDIDKSWHAIHFLLTGTAWEGVAPLDFIVNGGASIGDVDVGYGPARGFDSKQVRAIWSALEPLSSKDLDARYDAQRMRKLEIYACVDNLDEYLVTYFDELRRFIEAAVKSDEALLVWLS
jgi:hypothetical protein